MDDHWKFSRRVARAREQRNIESINDNLDYLAEREAEREEQEMLSRMSPDAQAKYRHEKEQGEAFGAAASIVVVIIIVIVLLAQ